MNKKQKKELAMLGLNIVVIILNTLWFVFIWQNYYSSSVYYIPFYGRGNYAIYGIFAVVYYSFAKLYGGFGLKNTRATEIAYSHTIAIVMTGITMYFIIWLLTRYMPAILPIVYGMALWIVTAVAWAKPANLMMRRIYPPTPTVIVYDNPAAFKKGMYITKVADWRYNVVGTIDVKEGDDKVFAFIHEKKAEAVMLCGIHSSPRNTILKYCIAEGMEVYIRPNIGDYIVNSSEQLVLANLPIMLCNRSSQAPLYAFVKRAFDIFFALVILVIFSPVLLIVGAIIKMYDGGPALYSQDRLTKNGKIFKIYKFRSMRVDAEKDGVARLAQQDDDRITPIGKFIRATRIDELPQMINILRGEMSVVGPRPERPEITAQYERNMPEFSLRLQVKAGLTGYAQVHGRYNTSPYDKLQMDLMYIANQSIATDFKIILETVKVVFMPESTEGIAEGETTAADQDVKTDSETEKKNS